VVITSEVDGNWLDAPEFEPFWSEAEKLELFVFIHPVLALNDPRRYDAYDIGRSVGREFSLIMATVRLINSGVLDRHPKLVVQMSHLAGGIATMLGRLRSYQDKEFWGTAGHPLHGKKSERDLDYYINERIVFDVGGFCGEVNSVKAGLAEIPASRMVFATDYPQEIRGHAEVRDYVSGLRALGSTGEQILSGNVSSLLNGLEEANLAAIR
jgi:predicted TIM-barrel fold metal-dependent hydrolase